MDKITVEDYDFALHYCLARLIFSNGARAEYAYKSCLSQILTFEDKDKTFRLLVLEKSKTRSIAMLAMDESDYKVFDMYQQIRRKVAVSLDYWVKDDEAFVTYRQTPLDHHVSRNINQVMVSKNSNQ